MSNRLQDAYRNQLAGSTTYAAIALLADTLRATFIDAADTPVPTAATLAFSNLTAAGVVNSGGVPGTRGGGGALATKTGGSVATGVFDAADTTLTALSGDQAEYIVVYKDSGTDSTSYLLAFWDTFTSGMPVTPNGGDVVIVWNSGGLWGV